MLVKVLFTKVACPLNKLAPTSQAENWFKCIHYGMHCNSKMALSTTMMAQASFTVTNAQSLHVNTIPVLAMCPLLNVDNLSDLAFCSGISREPTLWIHVDYWSSLETI